MKHPFSSRVITIFVLLLLAGSGVVSAQPSGQITGKLTDAKTGNPVAGAMVFLSQTMRAALTAADGSYHLDAVPTGNYDLVASAEGYLPMEQQVEVLPDQVRKADFTMKQPLPSEVPAVAEAIEKRGRSWRQGFSQFEKLFIGNTANAKETRILNPEVLDFSTDRITGKFRANATKPLLVENRALGYRVTFVLQSFVLDPHLQVLSYTGRPYFAELEPVNAEEQARWEEIRQQTWYGSLNHMLASLARNRLEEEGYVLKRDLMREEQQGQGLIVIESQSMSRQILDEKPLRVQEIVKETQRPGEYEMSISEYVRIIYRGKVKRPAAKYRKDRTPEEQISWMVMQTPWAVLYQDGSIFPSNAIRVHGFMAGYRVAEMMPREYLPPSWRQGLVSN